MENHVLVRTGHLNHKGNLFGGQMLLWVDECAYMAARKDFPDLKFVTRAISDVQFQKAIPNGSVLNINCTKNRIGRTSVTYDVSVISYPPQQKKGDVVFETRVTFVAVDDDGNKVEITK